uniref:LITAF domain-containing protein n=1 Tax=Acrobeloides nanus TaxID=290746 RepID=A0A914D2E1_9BILA
MSHGTTVFGPDPQHAYCPNCGKNVMTHTEPKLNLITWLICLLTGFWCILCCCDCTKDVDHRCSVCATYLGSYKR